MGLNSAWERAQDRLEWHQLMVTANSPSVTCHLIMSMYFINLLPVSMFTLGGICVARTYTREECQPTAYIPARAAISWLPLDGTTKVGSDVYPPSSLG